MLIRIKNHDYIFRIFIIGLYIVLFFNISQNLRFPFLWYDESVQFWVSKGLSPYADPYSQPGNFQDVIENNKFFNMDPGGFGILLHYWSKLSNHHIWLRLLPFSFLIGIILSIIYLFYTWMKNINLALTMGLLPFFFPMLLNMGFEIRAYSMEAFCTLYCIIMITKLKEGIKINELFLMSLFLALLITSRYSSILVAFASSLYVLYLISIHFLSNRNKIKAILVYSIPLFISLYIIYFSAMRYQNASANPLFYLPYLSKNPEILFLPFNLIYILILVSIALIQFLKRKFTVMGKLQPLIFLTLCVNIIFIALSFAGKHPWDPSSNRCISMVILTMLCVAAIGGACWNYFSENYKVATIYLTLFLLGFVFFLRKNALFPRLEYRINTFTNFTNIKLQDYNSIYVEFWESPYIRYLFEYGPMGSKYGKSQMNKFYFSKGPRHGLFEGQISLDDYYKKQPKMNDLLHYDLLITPVLFNLGQNDKWILIKNTSNFWIKKSLDSTIK